MLATIFAVFHLARSVGRGLADPQTRGLMLLAALVLAAGTGFYMSAEGWSMIDRVRRTQQ